MCRQSKTKATTFLFLQLVFCGEPSEKDRQQQMQANTIHFKVCVHSKLRPAIWKGLHTLVCHAYTVQWHYIIICLAQVHIHQDTSTNKKKQNTDVWAQSTSKKQGKSACDMQTCYRCATYWAASHLSGSSIEVTPRRTKCIADIVTLNVPFMCLFAPCRQHSELLVLLSWLQHAGPGQSRCPLYHSDQWNAVSSVLLHLWDEDVSLFVLTCPSSSLTLSFYRCAITFLQQWLEYQALH